jgi:hypothetical protein
MDDRMTDDGRILLEPKSNGYEVLADAHRKLKQEREAEIFDFLAKCTDDDICTISDSGALNRIIKAYCKVAMQEAGIDFQTADNVIDTLRWVLSEQTAKDVLNQLT